MSALARLAAHVQEHDLGDNALCDLVAEVQAEQAALTPVRVYAALTAVSAGVHVDAVFARLTEGAEL